MSSRSRIPLAIEQYLQLPTELSLTLVTGTLNCSPTWLSARFVSRALAPNDGPNLSVNDDGKGTHVVLASWMRDLAFWKNEIRRATGQDISRATEQQRFTFMDFLEAHSKSDPDKTLDDLQKRMSQAVSKLKGENDGRVILLLDSPDVLLATTSITAQQLASLVFQLRGIVYSTVIVCSSDAPLVLAATSSPENVSSPLEAETASFITQQAHAARYVMSVRELDTGAAKDVSGVLRVTRSGGANGLDDSDLQDLPEIESLYLVQRDGNVRVFQRGAESG